MKDKVRKNILKQGIMKPCQANLITKDLLGEGQVTSDEFKDKALGKKVACIGEFVKLTSFFI